MALYLLPSREADCSRLNVQKEHEIKQIFVIDSVVFSFDACSRLSLRSLLCFIPPLPLRSRLSLRLPLTHQPLALLTPAASSQLP